MPSDWNELKISQLELDRVLDTGIVFGWAIAFTRILILHQSEYRKSFLLIQATFLFLNLLFFFPINLIVCRELGWLDNNAVGLITVLIATLILSFISIIVCDYYLWQRAKKLRLLSKLLTKVEQYNQLINNLSLIAHVSLINNNSPNNSLSVSEFKTALNLTKDSLLKSIELESWIYRYQQNTLGDCMSGFDSYERLLADLEDDLVTWSSLEDCTLQDRHLLDEAINLGLSVHREVRQIKTSRELNKKRER